MILDREQTQALWVFGAMERLQALGIIEGVDFGLHPRAVELFVQIDESRKQVFDNEEDFETLIRVICNRKALHSEKEIKEIIEITREYRDDRDALVRFALFLQFNKDS